MSCRFSSNVVRHRAFIVFAWLIAVACQACPVPVFRYALERWSGDPFQLVVFHRGGIDPAMDKELTLLEPVLNPDAGARANVQIKRIDVSKAVPPLWASLWETVKDKPLPSAALCTPEWRKGDDALWSGPLDSASLTTLTDSPKRRELVSHLIKGTAVVWIIVETADTAKNEALAKLMAEQSTRLAKEIIIPGNVNSTNEVRSSLPIEVSFATVKLRADDPSEALLLRMLNNDEPVLEPTLCPVFGRGRALAMMPQKNVNPDLLDETARFICGACSCQVKAQNPGFDLMIKADWDSIFGDQGPPPMEREPAPVTKPAYVPIPKRKAPM